MNIKPKERKRINKVLAGYCGYMTPKDFANVYSELEKEGVEVDMITNRKDNGENSWWGTCGYKINGEEVENSMFVLSVYESYETERNEYNCYVS